MKSFSIILPALMSHLVRACYCDTSFRDYREQFWHLSAVNRTFAAEVKLPGNVLNALLAHSEAYGVALHSLVLRQPRITIESKHFMGTFLARQTCREILKNMRTVTRNYSHVLKNESLKLKKRASQWKGEEDAKQEETFWREHHFGRVRNKKGKRVLVGNGGKESLPKYIIDKMVLSPESYSGRRKALKARRAALAENLSALDATISGLPAATSAPTPNLPHTVTPRPDTCCALRYEWKRMLQTDGVFWNVGDNTIRKRFDDLPPKDRARALYPLREIAGVGREAREEELCTALRAHKVAQLIPLRATLTRGKPY